LKLQQNYGKIVLLFIQNFQMLLNRLILSQITPYIDHKNAIVITGARQVGKTSILKKIFADLPEDQKIWFDFENPLHYKFFEDTNYDAIMLRLEARGLNRDKRAYVFIDEIQNFPDMTKIIKYLIDHYQVKFFVTGSASFYLKNLFPESLAGRKFIFQADPLNFQEFLYFKNIYSQIPATKPSFEDANSNYYQLAYNSLYEEFKSFGGFPEVVLASSSETKFLILENIFKSFFEQDILRLADHQNIKEIRDLLLLLTQRIGSKLNVSQLANELGSTRIRINSYLEFLKATFVIDLIPMFSSLDNQIGGHKKPYFIDSGLLNLIAKVNEGQLLENTIYNQLKHYGNLSYYSDKHGREIDFILNKDTALEVKRKATPHDCHQTSLLASKLKLKKYYLLSEQLSNVKDSILYPQCL
jgi:predicted AAA+ superfamily ATPase